MDDLSTTYAAKRAFGSLPYWPAVAGAALAAAGVGVALTAADRIPIWPSWNPKPELFLMGALRWAAVTAGAGLVLWAVALRRTSLKSTLIAWSLVAVTCAAAVLATLLAVTVPRGERDVALYADSIAYGRDQMGAEGALRDAKRALANALMPFGPSHGIDLPRARTRLNEFRAAIDDGRRESDRREAAFLRRVASHPDPMLPAIQDDIDGRVRSQRTYWKDQAAFAETCEQLIALLDSRPGQWRPGYRTITFSGREAQAAYDTLEARRKAQSADVFQQDDPATYGGTDAVRP